MYRVDREMRRHISICLQILNMISVHIMLK